MTSETAPPTPVLDRWVWCLWRVHLFAAALVFGACILAEWLRDPLAHSPELFVLAAGGLALGPGFLLLLWTWGYGLRKFFEKKLTPDTDTSKHGVTVPEFLRYVQVVQHSRLVFACLSALPLLLRSENGVIASYAVALLAPCLLSALVSRHVMGLKRPNAGTLKLTWVATPLCCHSYLDQMRRRSRADMQRRSTQRILGLR